jgi:hypothetical protein
MHKQLAVPLESAELLPATSRSIRGYSSAEAQPGYGHLPRLFGEGAARLLPPLIFRVLVAAALSCMATPAQAAGKDAAAQKRIDEALNVHYAASKFNKAEQVLRAAIQTCGAKACSKEVLGKIHVAVGVVRGKAQRNPSGARKAFEQAKKLDPDANLDPKLVSPPVDQALVVEFYKIMGRAVPAEYARGMGPVGKLLCLPAPDYEIQTAQPIAVVCDPPEGAVRAELYYRFGAEPEYTSVLMSVHDGTFRANVPCESLSKPGELELYIIAQDFNQEKVDSFGSAAKPARYKIVNSTSAPIPRYPGEEPPKRCTELLSVRGAFGETCSATQSCKVGLYCRENKCDRAPACETDSDCASARCSNGYCAMESGQAEDSAQLNQWMIGVYGGLDLWFASSAKSVCGERSQRDGDFFCYNHGQDEIRDDSSASTNRLPMTDSDAGGNTAAGFRRATLRVMLSVDRVLTDHLSLGGRLGWAFLGGPRSLEFSADGSPRQTGRFLPIHAEARATLWLFSLANPGLHPSLHLSAGLAEVDASTPINARLVGNPRKLDAWRRMGPLFVGGGAGVLYRFNAKHGVRLDLNAMYLLPATGLVLEPTLGGVIGF